MPICSPLERLDTMQVIGLAAGVEVELYPAGPVVRAKAWLIDLVWIMLWYFVLGVAAALVGRFAGAEGGMGVALLLAFFMSWGYRVVLEKIWGATPGKKRCGLKVVMTSGAPLTWNAAMLRNLIRVADFLPAAYATGLLSCLFTHRFQRLGDLVADTMVVYAGERTGSPELMPSTPWTAPMPPALSLTREERAAIVRFTERFPMWTRSRREELAAHAERLTGEGGPEGVRRLAAIGYWLRDS